MYVEEKMIHNFFFFLTYFFFSFFSFEIFLGGITFAVSLAISTTYYLYGSLTATFVLVAGSTFTSTSNRTSFSEKTDFEV